MSTIQDIISAAYRESGITQIGTDPDSDQIEEGLPALTRLYRSFFGNELGEQLTSIDYGYQNITNEFGIDVDDSQFIDSLYAPVNSRLVLNLAASKTIYLDPKPMDGARFAIVDAAANLGTHNVTIDGNGRNIGGSRTTLLNTDGDNKEWFYRADLANWLLISDFELTDDSPLPIEFDDLLITALAFRLNPRHGAETTDTLSAILTRMKSQFRARYRQNMEQHSENGLIRLPSNRFWRYTNSNTAFNRGKLA